MANTASYWGSRTALVTGATRGIGRATALLLAERGAHVIVHGRSEDEAESVVGRIRDAGGTATVALGDLRDPDVPAALVDAVIGASGRLDALVNNAGANVFRGTADATLADWDDCLNLDLRAVWLCSQAAARVMGRGSAIVNVTSNHAGATMPGIFPYNVAKAGVNALTQSLAIELAPLGIRANAVAPGYIDTPINEQYFATFDDPAGARRDAEALHPLGRLGTAAEVAHAIDYLADGERSGFTTGSVLSLDGGRSALLQDPAVAAEAPRGAENAAAQSGPRS